MTDYPSKGVHSVKCSWRGRERDIYAGILYTSTLGGSPDAAFRLIFGRMPSRSSDATEWVDWLQTPEQRRARTIDAMLSEGADAAFIHAYRCTGIIVHPGSVEGLPDDELHDWFAHVDQFRSMAERSETDLYFADNKRERSDRYRFSELYTNVPFTVVHLAAFLQRGYRQPSAHENAPVICFGAFRAIQTLRAIKVLIDGDYGSGVLALLRTCHEIWIRIAYFRTHPEKAVPFLLSEIDQAKPGKRRQSAGWSNMDMLRALGNENLIEFHRDVYQYYSGDVHLGAETIGEWYEDGVLHFNDDQSDDSLMQLVLINVTCLMVCAELSRLDGIKAYVRRDLTFHTRRIRRSVLHAFARVPALSDHPTWRRILAIVNDTDSRAGRRRR